MSDLEVVELKEGAGAVFARGLRRQKWVWSYAGAILLFLAIVFVSSDPIGTLTASANFASFFILVGLGQMLVITFGPGNIDLSVPYTIGLGAFVSMDVMTVLPHGIVPGLIAGLLTGAAIGAFNFGLIRSIRLSPMIATLASGFMVQTISIVFFRGLFITPPHSFQNFADIDLGIVPMLFLVSVAIALVVAVILSRTRYGRSILAIGQNTKAASLAGVKVNRTKFITYVACGGFAALTGILLAATSGGATPGMGSSYLLDSIAVPVIGGSSIAGGDSNVSGIVGASLLLMLILYLLDVLGFTAGLRNIFTGVIIVVIIFAGSNQIRRRG